MSGISENILIIENISDQTLENLLPKFRYDWIMNLGDELDKLYTFAYQDTDKKTLGLCIYATQKPFHKRATFLYLYIMEDYRNKGIAKELVANSLFQFKKWGFKHVVTSALTEDESALLKNIGYTLHRSEHHMVYTKEQLLSSKIGSQLEKLAPLRKHVKKYNELTPHSKREFNKILNNDWYHGNIDDFNQKFTRYFTDKNDELLAYMALNKSKNDVLMNTDFYTVNTERANMALPAMLSDVLVSGQDFTADDSHIVLCMSSKSNVAAMEQGFGTPKDKVVTDVFHIALT